MSSIDELMAAIAANISQLEQAVAGSQGSGSQAEELSGTFAGLGAEASAGTLSAAQTQLAEAAQLGASYLAKLKEAAATAEAARGATLSGTSSRTASGHTAYAGDPLKPVEEPVSEHRQELAGGDDATKSRAGRAFRQMGRRSEDVQAVVKGSVDKGVDIAKAMENAFGAPGPTTASTKTAPEPPTIGQQQYHVGTVGDFTSAVLFTAISVGVGVQALLDRRNKKRGNNS